MSEEQIQKEHECSCTKLSLNTLVLITLLFSVATFALTIINTLSNIQKPTPQYIAEIPVPKEPIGAPKQAQKDAVVISKQYDKGQSFEKAKATKKPIVVFFYTDWCGFCQRFAPTFHKVVTSKEIKKNFAVAYVNCDLPESRKAMEEFGVQAFPTVYVIKDKDTKKQLENQTFFTETAAKDLPKAMLDVIK